MVMVVLVVIVIAVDAKVKLVVVEFGESAIDSVRRKHIYIISLSCTGRLCQQNGSDMRTIELSDYFHLLYKYNFIFYS